MSGREWRPGDVAMMGSFVSLRVQYGPFGCPSSHAHDGDHWHRASGDWVIDGGSIEPRPLVVIDPEDREQVERLATACRRKFGWDRDADEQDIDATQAALREFANPTPPKPDEPTGLGAVVEDAEGTLWVRLNHEPPTEDPWKPYGSRTLRCAYADIAAVRVLSEGVSS